MSRQSFLDYLIQNNELSKFIQMRQDGKSQKEIADAFNTSQPIVSQTLKKIQNQNNEEDIDKTENNPTPYEILYERRKEVVRLKREGKYNVEIAQIMGVSDKDVFDFFEKRVKLTPKQVKEIKIAYENGQAIDIIASNYGTSPQTIMGICKGAIVSKENNNEIPSEVVIELDCISKFYQFVNQIQTKFDISAQNESKIDKEMSDLLHKIEISDCSEEESLRIIKRIKELRQERRDYKDYLSLVTPLTEFLKDENNAKVLKTLANIAGRVNNKAHQIGNRVYFLRTKRKRR